MQLLLIIFLGIIYLFARHIWRNRNIYLGLYRLFSGARSGFSGNGYSGSGYSGPETGPRYSGPGASGGAVKEKRIITCTYCGSNPEISNGPCSKCGRML